MNRLEDKYSSFISSIDCVVQFMNFIDMQKSKAQDNSLELSVILSPIPYNATIISLYGDIELFIDEISEVYIDEVYKIVEDYSELPKKMRDKHEVTSGDFLSNPNRFNNYGISTKDLIRNLNDCLQGETNALLNKKMILRHGGNLKSEQTFQFFVDIGLENIKNQFLENETFVSQYAFVKGFSEEDARERLSAIKKDNESMKTLFVELDDLVEQRNQVAHSGKVDEKKSFEYIKEVTIPFLRLFTKVVTEILTNELINLSIKKNKINRIPEIKDIFNNKIILLVVGDKSIQLGDNIAYTNGTKIGVRKVESIRVGDKDQSKVDAGEAQDVTILVDKKVKKNWTFFMCDVL